LGGRAEHVDRSVRTASAIGARQDSRSAFSPRDGNGSTSLPQTLRQVLRAAHSVRQAPACARVSADGSSTAGAWTRPRCAAASGRDRRGHGTKRRIHRERILRTGKTQSRRLRHRGSATRVAGQEMPRTIGKRSAEVHACLGAAQLTAEADMRPYATLRLRLVSARRKASRCFVRFGRMQLNGLTVRRTTISAAAYFPPPNPLKPTSAQRRHGHQTSCNEASGSLYVAHGDQTYRDSIAPGGHSNAGGTYGACLWDGDRAW